MIYDIYGMIYDIILYYIILYYIIYITAIELTADGSNTVHIYTQTIHKIHRTEQT
jgi:hypothetical protein